MGLITWTLFSEMFQTGQLSRLFFTVSNEHGIPYNHGCTKKVNRPLYHTYQLLHIFFFNSLPLYHFSAIFAIKARILYTPSFFLLCIPFQTESLNLSNFHHYQ